MSDLADMKRADAEKAVDGASADRNYRVLARKYRPRDFSDLIGQEPMVRTLTNAFKVGRIAQAWMLTGVRGVGKTTTARILARALNYETETIDQPTIEMDEMGRHCQAIMEGRHVDVIEMDAASHTGIDDIREIIDQVRYVPSVARYKVFIIDEVHMLSTAAFNGLLKTLEEPPPHVKFVFATTEIRKVPLTILSRTQRFDLRRVDAALLTTHLRTIADLEEATVEDEALAMVARAAEGSVRDALSILDQAIAHGGGAVEAETVRAMLGLADRGRIIDLFEHLMAGDLPSALADFRAQYDVGADPAVILTELAEFNHLVTRLRFVPEAAEDVSLSEDERRRGQDFAQRLSVRTLSRVWQMLLKGIAETREAPRPLSAAEMVLIRVGHAADLPSLDEAIRAAGEAPDAPAPSAPNGGGGGSSARGGTSSASARSSSTVAAGPSGGPAMRLVAGGGAEPQAASSVAADSQPEHAESAPIAEADTDKVPVRSLQDIAALADTHRDVLFKTQLKRFARLVSIEPGRIAIQPTDEAPPQFLQDLMERLTRWTERRWMVSTSREGGGPTLAEIEGDERASRFADAEAHPVVAEFLKAFPGAKVTDVRYRAELDEPVENAAPESFPDDGTLGDPRDGLPDIDFDDDDDDLL